jgi:hypothetical protein
MMSVFFIFLPYGHNGVPDCLFMALPLLTILQPGECEFKLRCELFCAILVLQNPYGLHIGTGTSLLPMACRRQ